MIVPVQPKLIARLTPAAEAVASPATIEGSERHGGPSPPEDTRAPSIEINRLVVETGMPLSTGEIREGFHEAWLRGDHTARLWSSDAFRGGLTIDLPPEVTGRELGRRLAQAILQRARVR
jgi:hypothetical protein